MIIIKIISLMIDDDDYVLKYGLLNMLFNSVRKVNLSVGFVSK